MDQFIFNKKIYNIIISVHKCFNFIKGGVLITNECFNGTYWRFAFKKGCSY